MAQGSAVHDTLHADNANVCFIFTEWGEVKAVKPYEYKKIMRTPPVYNGRNIYDIEDMKIEGVEYYSIGRPYVKKMVQY